MKKDLLKKYAEAGVRERLRQMQEELTLLYREFPEIVGNANGSLPSVLPLVLKTTARAAKNGHGGARRRGHPVDTRTSGQERALAFLAAHPGASTPEIAAGVGMTPSTTLRKFLKRQATAARTGGAGSRKAIRWTLRA